MEDKYCLSQDTELRRDGDDEKTEMEERNDYDIKEEDLKERYGDRKVHL